MNSVQTINCPTCEAELRLGSLFCHVCGASLEETSSWPDKPWFFIWVKPRSTIRAIIDSDPEKYVLFLAILAGIVRVLDQTSERGYGDILPFAAVLILSVLFGGAAGLISLFISGAVFRWTGSWFGGRASSKEVRAAVAWSSIPSISMLLIWVLLIAVYGKEMFTSVTPTIDNSPYILLCSALPSLVLILWAFILLLLTISEVHRFSIWKALGTVAIPVIAVLVPFLACGLLLIGRT